jgi:hypothetical protein
MAESKLSAAFRTAHRQENGPEEEKKRLEGSWAKKKDQEEDGPILRRLIQNKITPLFPQ